MGEENGPPETQRAGARRGEEWARGLGTSLLEKGSEGGGLQDLQDLQASPPPPPHPPLQGLMNTVTHHKPPAQWTALHFLTHCHPLLSVLLTASRAGQGRAFPPLNHEETGPERWNDLSKVTQILSGGDRPKPSRAAWRGGEEGPQGETTGYM